MNEIIERMRSGKRITETDSDFPRLCEEIEHTKRLVGELNTGYHSPDEVRALLERIWGQPLDSTVRMFPPFYTAFGKLTRVGKENNESMSKKLTTLLVIGTIIIMGTACKRTNNPNNENSMENLNLTTTWDKTFPQSDKVNHNKVTFTNRYGLAINAAAADPRIKATVASTMYDMSRVNANGYFDADDSAEARNALRKALAAQRTEDYRNGFQKPGGGVPDELPVDAPQFLKDYYDYYKTPRGYHPRSLNSNQGRNATTPIPFINFPLMNRADEIESAVLIIHGEKAHSRYFGEDAFKKLTGDNKELMIIPGASHTDLYDKLAVIPFDKLEAFFQNNLK